MDFLSAVHGGRTSVRYVAAALSAVTAVLYLVLTFGLLAYLALTPAQARS